MLRPLPSTPLGPDAAPFLWLLSEADRGRPGALLTIAAVHGGAPRPIGTHMAVVSGKRFEGYLSGGCVESAIATEVEAVMAGGHDRILRFGKGSPFFDIRFPCGGGIDVLIHVAPSTELLEDVLDHIARRSEFGVAFNPEASQATLVEASQPTGWCDGSFLRTYRPRTRLCLAGRGPELEAVARLGAAAQYEVMVATPDAETVTRLSDLPIGIRRLGSPRDLWDMQIDPWTATVLLFHEREWERPILSQALAGPGFYIGALGSVRTQAARRSSLLAAGLAASDIDRITGPIGTIPSARDPHTLALSVLSEIALRRRAFDESRWHGPHA